MFVKKHIGVFAIEITPTNNVLPAPDQVLTQGNVEWLFDRRNRRSLLSYWNEVTPEHVLINATVHKESLSLSQADWDEIVRSPPMTVTGSRLAVSSKVVSLLNKPELLNSYSGVVFFLLGNVTVDSGAISPGKISGLNIPSALFDSFGVHQFMCHEVGHCLGLDHPFDDSGLKGIPPNGEYGDPTCIMSALNFGNTQPGVLLDAGDRGPFILRDSNNVDGWWVGPGVSIATVWRHIGNFPNGSEWVTVLPNGATAQKLTLSKVNYGTRNNLVALKVQNGNVETFYTVEYRPRSQWDAGLDAGLRGEFVIHRIRDVGNVGQNAPGRNDWPKPNAVTLVGSLPQCGNLDFSANGVGIRVVDRNEFRATVSVGASLPAGAGVIIKASESSSLLSTTSSNQTAVVNDVGPRCQSANYTVLIDRYQSTVIIAAECHGIIDPRFRFLFNGNPVLAGAWSGPGTSLMGFENWKLSIYQPTSLTNGVDASGSFSVNVSIFENQLSVNLPVGLGDISMSLGVEVSSGSAGLVVGTATTQVVAKTLIYRLPDEAYLDQGACLLSQVIRVQRSWPPSDNEHPDWEQRLKEVVNQATYPIDINQGLIAKFAADFGVTPQTLKPALDTIALRTR